MKQEETMLKFYSRYILFIVFFLYSTNIHSQKNNFIAILPETNNDLIHFEAENALVTNFSTSPTLNYSASSQRTLQLNTYNYTGSSYFTKYVIYVAEPGEYSLWYGGTPPGTKDELYPSYSSPISVDIDNNKSKFYREDVVVVENYSPGLYWVKTRSYYLEEGYHNITINIDDKRGYDGKYYFYLDSIFLFKGNEKNPGITPEVFPVDLENRSINQPFNTISYYQNKIKSDPSLINNYMSLAHIYILLGDFFNAIKMLNRVLQLDPKNKSARLLMAKSRIWNGDFDTGLSAYETYLTQFPKSKNIWREAAKISAWISKYDKSLEFYNNGIKIFPADNSLKINKALTYLWKGNVQEGLEIINSVEKSIKKSTDKIKELSNIYYVNGYPDYAVSFYLKSIKKNPEILELYLSLNELYQLTGDVDGSGSITNKIKENFAMTNELNDLLDLSEKKKDLKIKFISDLEDQVKINNNNIEMRELLIQTYFWNGMTDKSIVEYKKIITIKNVDEINNYLNDSNELIKLNNIINRISLGLSNYKEKKEEIKKIYFNNIIQYRTSLIKHNQTNNDETLLNLNTAMERLQLSVNEIQFLSDLNKHYISEYLKVQSSIENFEAKNNNDKDFFNSITSDSNWFFDSSFLRNELLELSKYNFLKADYLLSIIYLLEEDSDNSKKHINLLDNDDYQNKYIKYLNLLWNGQIDNTLLEDLISYYPHLEEEYTFLLNINFLEPRNIKIDDSILDNYNLYTTILDKDIKEINYALKELQIIKKRVNKVLYDKLVRSMYNHQENTFQYRYTIGDYYLQKEEYNRALEQFQNIISFDPYNISAVFKLGRLQQLTGNWMEAMDNYQYVFSVDPGFENSASMYNKLARNHPLITTGDLQYFVDTNRIHYKESLTSNFNLTSDISTSINWSSNTYSLYKWTDNRPPLDYRVDDFTSITSFKLLNNKLNVQPTLGTSIFNENFSHQSIFIEQDFNNIILSNRFYPIIGIESDFTFSYITLNGNYKFRQTIESNPLEVQNVTQFFQEYSITGFYPIENKNYLNSFSFRTYLKLDNRYENGNENLIFTGVQDLILGFIILRNPWSILNIYSTSSFETSTDSEVESYYSPDNVLVSTLGATLASWISVNKGVLGVSLRVGSGIYINDSFNDNEYNFTNNGDLEFNYTKNDRVMFIKLYGSSTFSEMSTPDYWSIQSTIGIRLNLYKLLAL